MSIASAIILLFLVGQPFAAVLAWLAWRFLGRLGLLLTCLVFLALVYGGFRAFYTSDRDLMAEFSAKTGIILPSSARLVQRHVDGYPFWSDYSCEGVITVDPKDFAILAERLNTRPKRDANSLWLSDRIKRTFGDSFEVEDWECVSGEGVDRFCWGLLRDGKTVFFYLMVT